MELEVDMEIDLDTDLDEGSTIEFFTFKNLLSFLVGLSWGTLIGLNEIGFSNGISLLFGSSLGVVFTLIQMSMFYFIMKLDKKQEPNLDSTLNKEGSCYLTIPANNKGFGKINIMSNGSIKTLNASTDSNDEITTGSRVKVVEVVEDNLKVVKL